ncbi:RNA polymerase II transcription factor SIII subunit A [Aspergillus eucalypticola CBS 122712]|uniref:RNA polymerase II transcription factor SIII subunit A n=1 Tax=Aspergillus eucalypticola (strain CBS 122712 / IBT 29274) TaxID=1448314 RepID=A0A317UUQ9_ASPEC|nr:RNA polymerase II transcription factor SIII subunit A [Aspergillus eucalypticola CBS 122712]PWY65136.1 RNA polymerase II transcription factor SIII subunit A [Aspergillus eucalypticola CBS 122712]
MPPPSLLQLCTATAIRNVKQLNDIGNIPYVLARPFLLKVESPEKLRTLELQSPHLMRDDEELWLEFIKRDIPRWDEYDLPEKPDCWYDVYCDLREQVQRAVEEDAEKLKMALDGISSERQEKSAKLVTDRRIIGLPRERPTARQRYASYDRRFGGSPTSSSSMPPWAFGRPRETKKKNSIFTATKRNNVLAVPTKHLNNRATQVRQAPRSLIEDHIRPAEPPVARRKEAPALRVPGRSRPQMSAPSVSQNSLEVGPSLREREARLRAITQSYSPATSDRPMAGRSAQTSQPTRGPSGSLSGAAVKKQTSQPLGSSATGSHQKSAVEDMPASPPQPPRPAVVRKRPAPNLFIQPKKKKLN